MWASDYGDDDHSVFSSRKVLTKQQANKMP